jgi:vacuolar-type H+-ATPase subunit H
MLFTLSSYTKRGGLQRDNVVMSMANDRAKKSKVEEFVPAADGLEGELAAFVNSLIEQNAELAGKLESMDSLMELAEKTVIEAGKEAEGIRAEAETEANARAAAIVARAVEKAKAAAQKVVARAKEKGEAEARRIIAEAGQKAEQSLQERLLLAEQQAQEIMKAAEETVSRIIAEAQEKAEEEALLIKKEAEQLLASGPKMEECQAVKNPWDVPDEIFWQYPGAQETKARAIKKEGKPPEPPVPPAAVSAAPEASVEKPVEQPSCIEEEDKKESPASYDDTVELALPPPVALDRMLKLHKHLKKDSRVKVVDLKGSLDKGVRIKLLVQAHTPLLTMLAALPEVADVSDGLVEAAKISSAHRKGNGTRPRIIAVTLKK